MLMRLNLILWTLSLSSAMVEGDSSANPEKGFQVSSRFETTLQAAMQILWKTFPANVRIEENFLFFPFPFIRDVTFIESLVNGDSKEGARKTLPLYQGLEEDLRSFSNELRKATGNDARFKTILYTNSTEFNKTIDAIISRMYKNPADPKDSVLVVAYSGGKKRQLWHLLAQGVEDSSMLASTCEVRFCGIWRILSSQPSFAIITLASWKIRNIAGFQWTEMVKFLFYETYSMDVQSLQSVAKYDYAEFKYPRLMGCTGRALRLSYNSDFHLTFVIPSTDRNCSTLEKLWKNFRDVDLNGLKYKSEEMFVSIPVFRVSSIVNLRWALKGTDLAKIFASNSSRLHKSMAFLATEFIFDPKLPPPGSKGRPTISPGTPEFLINRPFFFSISHISSRATVFTGLILYPGCIKQCLSQPISG